MLWTQQKALRFSEDFGILSKLSIGDIHNDILQRKDYYNALENHLRPDFLVMIKLSENVLHCSSCVKFETEVPVISDRSSRPEVLLGKGVLKICSAFTGEHPCWSVVSIKLQKKNCCLFSEHIFLRAPLDGCFSSEFPVTLFIMQKRC